MFGPGWLDAVIHDLAGIGPVRPEQTELVRLCGEFIDRQIPDDAPLWEACPRCDECWRTDRGTKPRPMSARIPYVGPDYPAHRIAVVGINSRDDGRPESEIRTTARVIESLGAGRREYGPRSYFHYRVACAVHNAYNSLHGRAVEERPDPTVIRDSLRASARLQAVQCSPQSTSRRTPTHAMVENCPEFLLRGQVEILAPRALLLLGLAAHRTIEKPPLDVDWDTTWDASGHCFSRGRTSFAGQEVTVLAFHHPSSSAWSRSWKQYLASLEAHSLASD